MSLREIVSEVVDWFHLVRTVTSSGLFWKR